MRKWRNRLSAGGVYYIPPVPSARYVGYVKNGPDTTGLNGVELSLNPYVHGTWKSVWLKFWNIS